MFKLIAYIRIFEKSMQNYDNLRVIHTKRATKIKMENKKGKLYFFHIMRFLDVVLW